MEHIACLKILLISAITGVLMHDTRAASSCRPFEFKCFNGNCIERIKFCDKSDDCGDNSDEKFCEIVNPQYAYEYPPTCPTNWINCPQPAQCIPKSFVCDGRVDCKVKSEEINCGKYQLKVPGAFSAQKELREWLLNTRNGKSTTDKWGSQVHRIAVALHLADESTFLPGNSIGDEIRYELTIKLLSLLSKDKRMNSQELALYIHALLVACLDPRDFYGENLVAELRRRVEESANNTNPFQILVLCNAGDTMTVADAAKVNEAYKSQLRPNWADVQAVAVMALACIRHTSNRKIDVGIIFDKLDELKELTRKGLDGDFRATALVSQARLISEHYMERPVDIFHENIQFLIDGLQKKSVIHAYYALPVFSANSLNSVNSTHCKKKSITEEEALQKVLDVQGKTIETQFSVWIGDEKNVAKSWNLRLRANNTIYDAIDTLAKIDDRQNVTYSLVSGKPYVTAVNEMEDDPELGRYWSVYLRSADSDEQPQIVKESPVDVKLMPNQEIILWYKSTLWNN